MTQRVPRPSRAVTRAEALGEATEQNRGGSGKEQLSPLYGSRHQRMYRNAVTHPGAGRLPPPNSDSAPSQPRTCLTTALGPAQHRPITLLPEQRGKKQTHLQVRWVLEAGRPAEQLAEDLAHQRSLLLGRGAKTQATDEVSSYPTPLSRHTQGHPLRRVSSITPARSDRAGASPFQRRSISRWREVGMPSPRTRTTNWEKVHTQQASL